LNDPYSEVGSQDDKVYTGEVAVVAGQPVMHWTALDSFPTSY